MSKFSEALERQRQRFSQGDGDDLYSQLMARARNTNVYDTNIPEIDTRGVEPYDDEWEDSWSKRIQRGFTGLEDIVGLGLKSLGALVKGRTAKSDEQFNNFIQDIYKADGKEPPPPIDTNRYLGDAGMGQILSNLGDYFYNAGHTPEREKAFRPSSKWKSTDYLDLIQSPSKLADYMTDTDEGFLYDLPYNAGNILGFLLPTKATTGTKMASTMNGLAGRIIDPVSGLLGKVGANRAANAIRSTAAKEALSDSLHFGTTMGPYGAMVNAGTIIDELKKQGKSDAEIADTMGEMFREELPADIAFAALTGNVLKGNLGKAIAPRGSSLGRKIAAQLPAIPLESAGGYLSNVNQMILSEKYSGQPYGELFGEHTDAEKQAGLMGAMAGLPLSVLGGYRGVRNAQVADQRYAAEQAYSDAREQAYGRQNIAQQALRDARQELGEGAKDSQVLVRANELFNQRINEQAGARQIDLSGEDEATQKIFDRFAQERAQAAVDNNDADAASFWNGMFSGNTFNNTTENRAAIRQRYGTELNRFAQTYDPATGQPTQTQPIQTSTPQPQQQGQTQQGQTQQQQTQPQQQQPTAKSTSNKYLRGNDNVIQAGNKFLEELRAKGTQADMETTVRLQAAITSGDTATVENILKANNRPIAVEQQTAQPQPQQQQQAQQQTDPVKQNQPPENIIQQESTQPQQQAQPKKQPKTPEGKAQSTLAKPLQSKKGETRRKAGNAVIFLADKNGIEISDADRKSLGNGKTAVVNKWRDILISKGILSPQATQSPPKQSPPAQPQTQQQTQPQAQETTQPQEAAQPAKQPLTLQERMQQIVDKAAQATWEQKVQEREDEIRARQKEAEARDEELRARQAEQEKVTRQRSQEAYNRAVQEKQDRELKAKQDKELQELQSRQEAEKRAAEEATQRTAEQEKEIAQRQSLPSDIAAALAPPSLSANTRKKQGNAIADLINSTPFKDMFGVISLQSGLEPALRNGHEKAINTARDILSRHGVRPVEWTQQETKIISEDAETPTPYEPPQQTVGRHEETTITHETPDRPPQIELDSALTTEPVAHDKAKRKIQGKAIHRVINSPQFIAAYGRVKLSAALESTLQSGEYKAIETVQRMLRERGIIPQPETQPEQATKPEKESTSTEEKAHDAESEKLDSRTEEEARDERVARHEEEEERDAESERLGAHRDEAETAEELFAEEDEQSTSQKEESPANTEEEQKQKEPTTKEKTEPPATKEKSKPKEGIEGWLEQQERQLSRQKEPTDVSPKETKPAEAKTEEKPNPETKSMEGEADTRIINVIEDESTLTPLQKLLKSFSEKLGVPLKFFRNPDGKFHGSFSNGVLFLNVNSKKGLGGVFWHEAFHWLKANNPKLYAKLVDAAGITDKDRQAFLERTKRKDLKTNEEIDEEILADQMDDVAKRTGLLQTIAGKNRGVVERVVQWLKDTMNKFIETFRNPTGGLTTKQAQALANEFGRIARQLKDENGEQIFRVNNRTGDIEVVEGRKARELSSEEIESAAKSPNVKYSVDPNDNSSESWGQRVANFARAVIGLRKPAPERIHQKMKRQLSELSDLKIAAGHLPEGVQEKIDEVAKVIRTGKEYDWVKVLPSVGNAVAAQLGITQSAEMGNYIGKFLYGESAPDTSAEAQEFKEAMRKNEDMRDKILACRDTFSQWRNMSTEEQMIASMRFEEEQKPFRTRAQNFWKSFKTQFVESLTPVQSAVDAFEKRTGMKLDDVINPMSAFRLLRGVGGRAQRMIVGGEKTVKALQAALPNLNLDNWKPIRMILEPIGAFEDQKTREAFSAYVTACHVMDIHRQNNNNLKKQAETQSKIDALKDELKLAGNKKERTRIEKSIERQEETLDSLKRNIKDIAEAWDTEEKCQTVINKYKDKFGAAQKELVDYSNTLLAMRVDAGLMTLERFNELLNVYPNYVPLHRVIDEVSGGDKADSMAHMAGSAKDIYDPIHAIMSNTFDTVRRCEKNKAKCLLATLARFDGVGQIFEEVEGGNSDGTTITFYENGKKKHLQCSDDTLVKAVNNLTPASMNWFIRALRIPTVILKGTATVLNINFGARNILRDSQDAYVYGAKHGGNVFKDIAKFMTPYAALKGAYDAFQMNDVFEEFMVNGGAQSTFLTFDANYEQDAFDTLIKGKYKRFASAKGVLKLLETLGSYSELGTRLGRFEQVKGNLKEKHGGINIYGDLVSAALESRDLMDFARGGEAGRTMNAVSAFANPAIQGWDKFFRTFDYKKLKRFGGTDETQRQWMTSAARLVIDSIVPAFLLTLLHHDDDWYKKDVQDWEKETHWILSDTIRIPKPADVGARFLSNFTEKMMEWALNNEPATFKKVFAPLWASLPDLLPTALQPVIECIANYDMFRRSPIVPRRESKLSPEMQYDSQSSNLAKFIGEKAGVSPRYIDHFIYGFTSNFGKGITRGMDTVAYKAGLSDRPPAFTRDWIPIIGGFLRVPYRNPKIVQDYYEALDKQESLLNDYKKHRKSDRNAKPSEEYDRALHARLKGAQNAMQALAAQERKVIEDQRLSSEEVDKRQREIQKRRVALCERVLGKAR